MLSTASPTERKQMIGKRLFPMVRDFQPVLAGWITGILLMSENSILLQLLDHKDKLIPMMVDIVQMLQQYHKHKEEGHLGYVFIHTQNSVKNSLRVNRCKCT